ncbi:hypothetical protein [Streptomyces sp. NPDC047046]|uniref:hypothetical protein n=1 Tax=Streptomyces sp. NPDC047046 TaxID=3155378 RepID=UPI0033F29180
MQHRRSGRALAGLAVALCALVACGGGGDEKDEPTKAASSATDSAPSDSSSAAAPSDESAQPIAEGKSGDRSVVITSAIRGAGGYVTVSGTVTNNGSGSWLGADWQSDETELASNGGSLAGASLVDNAARKKYLVLRDTKGHCLCTKFDGRVRAGQTVDWFAQFPAPPASTKKVTFQVGSMPPAEIPLSEAR